MLRVPTIEISASDENLRNRLLSAFKSMATVMIDGNGFVVIAYNNDRFTLQQLVYAMNSPQNDESQNVARIYWDGQGLPPVGTACEVDVAGAWISGVVLAHCLPPKEGFAVAQIDDEVGIAIGVEHDFRPIRTPGQIAADEREKAIKAMIAIVGGSDLRACIELYDAGYRKP